ncbi:hypothetical protein Pmani_032663 [Petrolisthes manimaculis]|uniref:Homologous recombination OB-fold protein OB-fold domain-containing protein n=1 Tax=Petrolisthes manimaculis TaxID=1843537 RepID=A0AAE1NSX3_9EUCA|nr:hypothetical protein Pmani_032663 [Petrolisthes manimaculis]
MFGGDNDDLSFVDDEFLQDVFHSDKGNVAKSKGYGANSAQKDFITPIPSLPLPNTLLTNHQERRNLNGGINEHQSIPNVENPGQKHSENPSLKHSPSDKKCDHPKGVQGNALDFDDNFPFDSLEELDECENLPPNKLATPPDSEITRLSNSRLGIDLQVNKFSEEIASTGCDKRNIAPKQNDHQLNKPSEVSVKTGLSDLRNVTSKPNDFRLKLLQTLKEKKTVHSGLSNCTSESSNTLGLGDQRTSSDTCGVTGRNCYVPPIKRLSSDACDGPGASSYGPPVKRLITQCLSGRQDTDNYEGTTTLPPVPSTCVQNPYYIGNQPPQIHTLPIGQGQSSSSHTLVGLTSPHPHIGEDILGQGQHNPLITPVKSKFPHVRKTVSPGGPVIQKRKFPGPAGILPQPGVSCSVPVIPKVEESEPPSRVNQTIICSQNSASDFTRGPWQQMIHDLELDPTDPSSLLQVFNIKWVVRRAGLRGTAGVRKVPFLAVLVHSLDNTHTNATVVLRDSTGEINGTVSSAVMDEFGDTLQTGSVMILRGVTVLSPVGLRSTAGSGEPTRRHYLNITLNTVLTIYTPDQTGHVITTTVASVDKHELHRQAASPTVATEPRVIVEEEEEEHVFRDQKQSSHNRPSLFSTNLNDSLSSSPGQGSFTFSPKTSVRLPSYTPVGPQQNNLRNVQRPIRHQSPVAAQQGNFSRVQQYVGNIRNLGNIQKPNQQPHGNIQQPGQQQQHNTNPQTSYQVRNIRPQQLTQRMPIPTARPIRTTMPSLNSSLINRPPPSSPVTNAASSTYRHPPPLTGAKGKNTPHTSDIICSQAEEEQVDELLSGLDTDSFFEDF